MNHFRQHRIYSNKFAKYLRTAHGVWSVRESIVLREEDSKGRVSYGEVCPTPGFLNYSLDDLLPIVRNWEMGKEIGDNILVRSAVSCMASKIWNFVEGENLKFKISTAELYHSNTEFNSARIYKKKIGVRPVETEINEVLELLNSIPKESKLRLDANESLTVASIFKWNEALKNEARLQFLEQPLPAKNLNQLFELENKLDIKLALDESLVWKNDFNFFKKCKWRGYFIIKPFLFADWNKTINFIRCKSNRTIVSTVFESPFGFEAACRCALYSSQTAGLDRHLFIGNEFEFPEHHRKSIQPRVVSEDSLEVLWAKL